jgi:hypothetical protein
MKGERSKGSKRIKLRKYRLRQIVRRKEPAAASRSAQLAKVRRYWIAQGIKKASVKN